MRHRNAGLVFCRLAAAARKWAGIAGLGYFDLQFDLAFGFEDSKGAAPHDVRDRRKHPIIATARALTQPRRNLPRLHGGSTGSGSGAG